MVKQLELEQNRQRKLSFLLEVGTEELPADFIDDALTQWKTLIPASLQSNSLTSEDIKFYATPRRIAVLIQGLPPKQPEREAEIKGPPAAAAFKDGLPTPAAIGFAKKQGVAVEALAIRATEKGEFVFVQQNIPGRLTDVIIAELAREWILGLEGKRLMRWGDGDLKFPRPIRTIVAMLDDQVLPLELVNGSETIKSDRFCFGHRILHPELVKISHAADYLESLDRAFVNADPQSRKQKIESQIQAEAKKVNGYCIIYPNLLQEVTNLVEAPNAVLGKFDQEFLNLPSEVITTVMVSHQRYFPVWESEDQEQLLPYFITISNGAPAKKDIIKVGNERVIRARLADGQFFYKTDLAKPIDRYLPQLEKVTFQEDLGSVRAKVERIIKNAIFITEQLQISDNERALIQRTALLCKADLVTQMVKEFPELQGIMGEKYARSSGEQEAVAIAISEHYLPKGAYDELPKSLTGSVVGIADRLDTLVSIFGLGMLPTGSSDPFALRRSANAVINIIWEKKLTLNLQQLLLQIIANFVSTFNKNEITILGQQLQEFFIQRIRSLLEEQGIDYDLINAVLGEDDPEYSRIALQDLLDVQARARFLQSIRADGRLEKIYETINRSTRLAAQGNLDTYQLNPENVVNPELFQKSSEQAFYDALVQLVPQTKNSQVQRNYQQLVESLSQIVPTVSNFFDGAESVLVMDSDPKIKQNRLNLLSLLRNHARVLADFGAIVKS